MDSETIVRSGKPYRPIPLKAINALGNVARKAGINAVTLNPDKLLKQAARKTGISDFGPPDFEEGLRRLLKSLEEEAELNLLGRIVANNYVSYNLENRLRVLDWRENNPDVAEERVEAPLVIVGLPRTGTTILHALLDCDPANRSPLFWELQYPVPPVKPEERDTDPRIAEDQKILDNLFKMVPGFQAMHPMAADMPQECAAIFTMNFHSEQLQTQFNVPSYQDWLDDADMDSTYAYHRLFLQHLQSGGVRGERWLLKSPVHFPRLDDLFREYPDARVIHTHRNPIDVCASISSLMAALRGMSSDAIDLEEIGAQQLEWWTKMVAKSLDKRKALGKDERIFDLPMKSLVADPVGAVRRIYGHFDLELTDETESSMNAFMAENTRDKHGSHTYGLADFGLDRERDKRRFDEYVDYYGLEEAETPHEILETTA